MMSTTRHAIGVICAGLFAFGAVLAAVGVTSQSGNEPVSAAESPQSSSVRGGTAADPSFAPMDVPAIVGRWAAEESSNPSAFLDVSAYGLWAASDGCNRTDGSWVMGEDGSLTTTGGLITHVGCNNDTAPIAFASAVSGVAAGDQLTFTSGAGVSTSLIRAEGAPSTLVGSWRVAGTPGPAAQITFDPDGSWLSQVMCSEYRGSWQLGPLPERVIDILPGPDNPDEATSMMVGPGLLQIDTVSEPKSISGCEEPSVLRVSPLREGQDYWFQFGNMNNPDTFSLTIPSQTSPYSESAQYVRVQSAEPQ